MDDGKKIELVAEVLDVDASDISPETVLDELEEWDSMTKLSLIVMFDDECGKAINSEDIKAFATVADVMAAMA